jgi:hypothetical protein
VADEAHDGAVLVAAHVTFGLNGNAAPWQLDGWSFAEPACTWAIDTQCRIRVPYRSGQGTLLLEITASPNLLFPVIRHQRLIVSANGVRIGDELVGGECTLGFTVPAQAIDGSGELLVTLEYPDSFVPKSVGANQDERRLGFSLRDMLLLWAPGEAPFTPKLRPPLPVQATGGREAAVRFCTALSTVDLLHRFESLGHNCEFGLMQRAAGAEPLGLLRFGGITPHNLLRGLDMAFEGIEDISRLRVFVESNRDREEYLVRDDRYSVQIHTGAFEGETTPAAVAAKLSTHLGFLRRLFVEVLEDASRIFVLHHPAARSQAQVLPVLNLLRSHGPNVLLYVTDDRVHAGGTVVQEKADLFHGYIDRLPPMHEVHLIDVGAWVSVCANTYRMWREAGHGG